MRTPLFYFYNFIFIFFGLDRHACHRAFIPCLALPPPPFIRAAIEYSNESAHVALAFGEAVAAAAANDDDDDDIGGDDDDDNGNNNGGGNSGSAGNANLADMVATSTS